MFPKLVGGHVREILQAMYIGKGVNIQPICPTCESIMQVKKEAALNKASNFSKR
jgi:hypothetical protein